MWLSTVLSLGLFVIFSPTLAFTFTSHINVFGRGLWRRPATTVPTALCAVELWIDVRSSTPLSHQRVAQADAILCKGVPGASERASKQTYAQRQDNKLVRHGASPDKNKVAGIVVDLTGVEAQDKAIAAVGTVEWIHVSCPSSSVEDAWRIMLAENLIAAAKGTGTKIAFNVNDIEDVFGLSKALELGVDALSVKAHAPDLVWDSVVEARGERPGEEVDAWVEARAELSEAQTTDKEPDQEPDTATDAGVGSSKPPKAETARTNLKLPAATAVAPGPSNAKIVPGHCQRITSTSSVLADRVCIDLVRTLSPSEGCWIGSSAKILALVLSESGPSAVVPARPFRVNAGPVHSYIVLGDGETTKYLSELSAGDEVLVYDAETGESRPLAVGRVNVEARPCVLVSLEGLYNEGDDATDDSAPVPQQKMAGQVFLQQAETVRLGKLGGAHVRITDLKGTPVQPSSDKQNNGVQEGTVDKDEDQPRREEILLRLVDKGTHVGRAYSGSVEER